MAKLTSFPLQNRYLGEALVLIPRASIDVVSSVFGLILLAKTRAYWWNRNMDLWVKAGICQKVGSIYVQSGNLES